MVWELFCLTLVISGDDVGLALCFMVISFVVAMVRSYFPALGAFFLSC